MERLRLACVDGCANLVSEMPEDNAGMGYCYTVGTNRMRNCVSRTAASLLAWPSWCVPRLLLGALTISALPILSCAACVKAARYARENRRPGAEPPLSATSACASMLYKWVGRLCCPPGLAHCCCINCSRVVGHTDPHSWLPSASEEAAHFLKAIQALHALRQIVLL